MSSKDKRRSGSTGGDDDGGSKAKKGGVRICGACQVGYIEPGDLHPRCLGCLGTEHAGLALTERASCMFCRLLPEDTLRSRADFFSENPEQYWLLSDVLDIEPPDRLLTEHHLQEPGSDDSASASHGSSSGSPLLPPLHLRGWSSALRATLYLPDIIKIASARGDLSVPEDAASPPQEAAFGRYNPGRASRPVTTWPLFPTVAAYVHGPASEPAKLKAPVSTFASITKVKGLTDDGFPPVPTLEPSLAALFGVKCNLRAGRRPAPPSPKDALTARLADRSHQCAFQSAAAANNIFVLANAISDLALLPDALPDKYAEEISKFSSAILALCAPIAIASARISAWQTMIARNVWLHLSSIPEAVRKDMLEGLISPDGLFGPHFQHLVREMQTASEEAEKIRRHVTAPSRSAGHWRDRRELSHRQRRPASSAAAASRPAPVQPAPQHTLSSELHTTSLPTDTLASGRGTSVYEPSGARPPSFSATAGASPTDSQPLPSSPRPFHRGHPMGCPVFNSPSSGGEGRTLAGCQYSRRTLSAVTPTVGALPSVDATVCVGQVDGQNNSQGLFSPVCHTPAELRGDPGNPAFIPSPHDSSCVRAVRSPGETGHQRGPTDGRKPGFLLSLLPGSKEVGGNEANSGSLFSQSVHGGPPLPHVNDSLSSPERAPGRLAVLGGPKGRIFSHSCRHATQEVSAFLLPGRTVPVQLPTVRLFSRPTHILQMSGDSTGCAARCRHESAVLFRRSPSPRSVPGTSSPADGGFGDSFIVSGFHDKLAEKLTVPGSVDYLPGRGAGCADHAGAPLPGEERDAARHAPPFDSPSRCHSPLSHATAGHDGRGSIGGSPRPPTHETTAALVLSPAARSCTSSQTFGHDSPISGSGSSLLEGTSRHVRRRTPQPPLITRLGVHRRFAVGMGRDMPLSVSGCSLARGGMSFHINALELLSVWNVLQHFAPVLLDCHVLVHTDNTTTASYINRQGGVRSSRLLSIARRLLLWAHSHLRSIRAVYIPGVLNTAADTMSRGGPRPGEWVLHTELVQEVWSRFGRAEVDLFAAKGNAQCPLWFSLRARDSPPPWGGCILPLPLAQAAPLCISACPSDSPVTRPRERGVSHRHPCGPKASGGTVVPGTLPNAGRPALGAPVAFGRIVLGQRDDPQSPSSAPAPVGLAPERKRLADQGFSPRVVATIQGARAASTTSSYVAKWSSFQRWCSERGVSASSCPLPRVLSFLQTLVDRGLSLSTVKTYAAAISSCHEGFGDRSVFSHPLLKRFLRGVRRQRPLLRPLAPPWDLSLVLRALVVSPFEPLEQVPLRLLSWKTALLLALTSMKRVSDLSALSVSPECLSIRGDLSLAVLRPNPAFMPKCITSSFRSRVITLEGFCTPPHTSEEDASSHLLCPVRALSYYVERTSTIRRSERLFVHYREGSAGLPLSAQRLSNWLCEAIFQAYESSGAQPPEGIRAHSTRGIASSVALLRGVSVEDICLAASWSSTCSFVRFYLRDVSRPSLSSSVLSAPQSAHSGVG
ncbi:hypothetical protein Q8A73_001340 [Channa argus]|nr:hypothetical protein Q8A73_001340 [Channa argus]